jgi:hypothetical protein
LTVNLLKGYYKERVYGVNTGSEQMELRAEVFWNGSSSTGLAAMKEHLKSYLANEETAIQTCYDSDTLDEAITEAIFMVIKCGKSLKRTTFFFSSGTPSFSEIWGRCPEASFDNLISDWSFLKERMRECGENHKVKNERVILNDEVIIKTDLKSYIKRREILAFFASSIGLPSIISAFGPKDITPDLFASPLIGLVLWGLITFYGYRQEGIYVFKRKA